MRMRHYFLIGAGLLVPALFATLLLGLAHDGSSRHLWVGLFTAALGIGVHTLVILFMLVTGRVLREAIRARRLPDAFLADLNAFFARKRAYPLAGLAAASLVAAGVLGYGARGFEISPAWHFLVGLAAVCVNLFALLEELRALRDNEGLVDRAARELDRIDRELAASGGTPEEPARASTLSVHNGVFLAIAPWLVYLYKAVIIGRGDFAGESLHPWMEISGAGVLLASWAAGRAKERSNSAAR